MRYRTAEHAANEASIQEMWPEFEALVPNDEVWKSFLGPYQHLVLSAASAEVRP
jgi:hypothetical protein